MDPNDPTKKITLKPMKKAEHRKAVAEGKKAAEKGSESSMKNSFIGQL